MSDGGTPRRGRRGVVAGVAVGLLLVGGAAVGAHATTSADPAPPSPAAVGDVTLPSWFTTGAPRLVEQLRTDGGFTVDPRTGARPATGFAVNTGSGALVVPGARFFDAGGAGAMGDFLRARPAALDPRSTVLFGGWFDRRSDRVVLSWVDLVTDRGRAVTIGAARHQTDVYDLAGGRSVPTGVVR